MERDAFRRELAQQLRVDAVRASAAAGSGHPTSSMSAAELMAVLVDGHLRYDLGDPDHPGNDHLIFSKGHASPLYYALLKAAGAIDDEELLSFRKLGSRLEGHPTPRLPWVDVATGSLGQGLPIGVGLALAGKRLDRLPYRVWILCGDSEMTEGSMWEAIEHAGHAQLENLVAIVDVNRLGQRGETMHGWALPAYTERLRSCGWEAIEVDGHDPAAIDDAYTRAGNAGRPLAVVARTLKGRGVPETENADDQHGKPLADADGAVRRLGGERDVRVSIAAPEREARPHRFEPVRAAWPSYDPDDDPVATRKAYGEGLAALGAERTDVVALDAEVSNSTYSELFARANPERFFEMYIAEQLMVAVAVGLQRRGYRPFASSFAAFLTRAFDFVRMAAISGADLCLVGSHAGVAIGEDGPSQMGLEDIAMFRSVHGSTVLHPCDPNQTCALLPQIADRPGVVYLRTLRGAAPTLYAPETEFPIGGSRILRTAQDGDDVTIAAAGACVHEALAAADELERDGIAARVLDLYSVKPIDAAALAAAAVETGGIVTVEDHRPEGGLGEAVLSALAASNRRPPITSLAVRAMPTSGTPSELMRHHGVDGEEIAHACRELLRSRRARVADGARAHA